MNFEYNQTFFDTYPPEAAQWCRNNEAHIEERIKQAGHRVFVIIKDATPSLEEAKYKAFLAIDRDTSESILSGFDWEYGEGVDAETLHFSYDAFDQQNFADTANVALLSQSGAVGVPTSVTWNCYRANGELVRIELSATEYLSLYVGGALAHKAHCMELGGTRKAAVENCESVEEVKALLEELGL